MCLYVNWVKGRHIIAFGDNDVAFTRGKIIGEV